MLEDTNSLDGAHMAACRQNASLQFAFRKHHEHWYVNDPLTYPMSYGRENGMATAEHSLC